MSTVTLDIPLFRATFPAFANATTYPDLLITAQWDLATTFISPESYGCIPDTSRAYALMLMTAHLLTLGDIIASGGSNSGTPGVVTSSKVGDVQVSLASPPFGTSAWRYWLSLSPYGTMLLGLLDALSAGGFYVGGLPERAAFRRVGGGFGGPGCW